MHPQLAWLLALAIGLVVAALAACAPDSGLPSQPPGPAGSTTGSSEATSSTPDASASTGGSVVPEIRF